MMPDDPRSENPQVEWVVALPQWFVELSELCARHRVSPRGIVHVGAHWAEELNDYRKLGATDVLWIEADPEAMPQLQANIKDIPGQRAIQACLSDVDRQTTTFFRSSNQGESSSMLPMGTHLESFKEIGIVGQATLTTSTFAALAAREKIELSRYDFLVVDVQGAELRALRGFGETLSGFDGIYAEVNVKEVYQGGAMLPEMDAFLRDAGFARRETLMTIHGYGDGLYLRESRFPPPAQPLAERLAATRAQFIAQHVFRRRVPGNPDADLEFLGDSKITGGDERLERLWLMRAAGHEILLEIIGIYGRSCVMRLSDDGVWRGRFVVMDGDVELIPLRAA